jgi:hypothetical protein
MPSCKHSALELLPERRPALRCRRCHLTISAEELDNGFCPECFAGTGVKHYDFEAVASQSNSGVRYRCEECGAIVASG